MANLPPSPPEVETPLLRWNPLRTYQFRIGILPRPPEADVATRTFLGQETSRAEAPSPVPELDQYIAGVKRVSGLNMTIAAHEIREGGNALHRYANPDRATWDPITLEQGLALDDTLERWARAAVDFLLLGVAPEQPVKRNVVIDVWDPGRPVGTRVRRYVVFNAWVSRFQAIPQLDATANEVALLTVELTHEGWRTESAPSFASSTPTA